MKQTITKALAVTAELLGTELSEAAMAVMVEDLSTHPEADVLKALTRCRRECRHRLTLADILDRLPNQPMGPDKAWEFAIAKRIWDEDATVVVPKAVFHAFPFALWPDDRVAARMAFKEAYPEALERYGSEPFISLGYDPKGRETAIVEAVRSGLLDRQQARAALPHLTEADLPQPPTEVATAPEQEAMH